MCEHCDKIEKANKNTLKKPLRDLPRYPVILEYEKEFKEDYVKTLKKMTFDLTNKLGDILLK